MLNSDSKGRDKIVVLASVSKSLITFRGHLIRAMIANGCEVICVAPDDKAAVSLRDLGAQLLTLPLARSGLNPISDLIYLAGLVELLRCISPDVVLAYTIKPVIYGSFAARIVKVPEVYSMITGLGYAFVNETPKQRFTGLIAKSLYRIALKNNSKVFFQNPDDLNEFVDYKIIEPNKTVLISGSGVSLEDFAQTPLSDAPKFLLIARLLKDKGIYEYVEAAKLVKGRFPHASFAIVGPPDPSPSGIDLNQLKEYVRQGIIEYHGRTDDVRPFISDANIYVLPSYYREGTPRTVLEAMAMGRPIITTDAPGCRETVKSGYNGFLVPVKNAVALSDAMIRFIQSPVLISQMGTASRKFAEKKYDVHKVNQIILRNMGLI